MKKILTRITHCSGAALALAALLGVTSTLRAQIPVNLGSNPVDAFGVIPGVTNWSTKTLPGAAGAPEGIIGAAADAELDAFVNGSTNAASTINVAVGNNAGNPPGTAATAQWSSAGLYLQTRPTGNAVTLLMATLTNISGGIVNSFTVDYIYQQRLTITGLAQEVDPGNRVYYSLSGAAGSWVALGNFGQSNPPSTDQIITIPVNVTATPWAPNTAMYILFADDNSNPNTDWANGIDSFAINNVVGGDLTCVGITNQSGNITVPERGLAAFSISATGTPQTVQWYRSDNGGGSWAAIGGAASANYSIGSAVYPGDNGARFYASVSNSLCLRTSTPVTLTVIQDAVAPTVVSAFSGPADNMVTVNFNEAMQLALIDAANFVVYPTGTDPDASPLIVTGATLNNGTNVVLITDIALTVGVNYSVRMLDLRDDSSANNIIDPNPLEVDLAVRLRPVDFGATGANRDWKYSTETNLFGTGWETVAYDDSAASWLSGPAPLGVDGTVGGQQPPILTATTYVNDSRPQFFRRHFTMPPHVVSQTTFTLSHCFEDGAVVFINGQEAGRYNVAAGTVLVDLADGTKGPRSAAAAADPTPVTGPVPLPLTNVVIGDNVIAVVVLQSGDTSSDSVLAIELNVSMPEYPNGPAVVTVDPIASTNVVEGQGFTLTAAAEGAVPLSLRWRKGGVDLPGQTGSSFIIAAAIPSDAGAYTFVASNSLGSDTSTVASVTVTADLTSPAFLSVVANTNLTNILLTFNERLNQGTAEDPGNYDVHLTAGGGALTIVSATLMNNGTNVLLVTSPRTQGQGYTIVLNNIIDTAVNENPATPSTRPVICEIVILAPDASTLWRYDSSSNNLDATGWQLTGYNDSAWPTALAGFTTSNNLEITTNGWELRSTNMQAPNTLGPPTTYYRVPFNLPASSLANVSLRLVGAIDDGLVAYINGVEAGRLRVTNASPVSFSNFTSGGSTEVADVHLPLETVTLTNLAGLVTGNNLLAIELHQQNATSSDAVLVVQVIADIQNFSVAGPTLHISQNTLTGAVTVSWSGSGTLRYTTNLLSAGTVWTPVGGNPNPYTFTPLPGEPIKFFSLAP